MRNRGLGDGEDKVRGGQDGKMSSFILSSCPPLIPSCVFVDRYYPVMGLSRDNG